MLFRIIMPQGGQDIEMGMVVKWHRAEGESVKKGDLLCEVETEKALFEVASPEDGILAKIEVPEGSPAAILSVIGWIGTEAADLVGFQSEGITEGRGLVDERGTPQSTQPRRERGSHEEMGMVRITPRAKKIAEDMGVDWRSIVGTGPRGRIVETDVLSVAARQSSKALVSRTRSGHCEDGEVIRMNKVGKVTARKMVQSKGEIPHFYVRAVVDMKNALNLREELNAGRNEEEQLTVSDLIVSACARALADIPELNRSVVDEENLVQWKDVNIGIVTATDAGLVVPVLESADTVPLSRLAQEMRKLVSYARQGKQTNLAAGRFTVSNMGMYGIDDFAAIINPPESAILAVGKIRKEVVALDDDTIGIRPLMSLVLSVDHRIADGAIAARFVTRVRELLEEARGTA